MSDESPRIAIWDTYQQQANPLIIEDDGWRDLRLSDLVALIRKELAA